MSINSQFLTITSFLTCSGVHLQRYEEVADGTTEHTALSYYINSQTDPNKLMAQQSGLDGKKMLFSISSSFSICEIKMCQFTAKIHHRAVYKKVK